MKYLVQTETFSAPGTRNSDSRSSTRSLLPISYRVVATETAGQKVVVLHPTPQRRRHGFNWYTLLGLVTMLGVSAASWTGIALLISHLMK